jgi:hypothetical protein
MFCKALLLAMGVSLGHYAVREAPIVPDLITPHCFQGDRSIIVILGTVVGEKGAEDNDKKAQRIPCEIRIDHVYVNRSNEKHENLRIFDDHYTIGNGGSSSLSGPSRIQLKKGQVGIWVLTFAEGLELKVFRRFLDMDAKYDKALRERMLFLESLFSKPESERFAYCLSRLLDASVPVAMSSAYSMGAIDAKRTIVFMSSSEFDKVPIAAQIDMDRSVAGAGTESWRKSELRSKMFLRWAQSEDDGTLRYLIGDICSRCQSPKSVDVSPEIAGQSLSAIATNARLSDAIRYNAIEALYLFSSNTGNVEFAFNTSVLILSNKASVGLRRLSSRCLQGLPEKNPANLRAPRLLSPEQIVKLEGLAKVEKDAEIAKHLEEAIAKAKLANQGK